MQNAAYDWRPWPTTKSSPAAFATSSPASRAWRRRRCSAGSPSSSAATWRWRRAARAGCWYGSIRRSPRSSWRRRPPTRWRCAAGRWRAGCESTPSSSPATSSRRGSRAASRTPARCRRSDLAGCAGVERGLELLELAVRSSHCRARIDAEITARLDCATRPVDRRVSFRGRRRPDVHDRLTDASVREPGRELVVDGGLTGIGLGVEARDRHARRHEPPPAPVPACHRLVAERAAAGRARSYLRALEAERLMPRARVVVDPVVTDAVRLLAPMADVPAAEVLWRPLVRPAGGVARGREGRVDEEGDVDASRTGGRASHRLRRGGLNGADEDERCQGGWDQGTHAHSLPTPARP